MKLIKSIKLIKNKSDIFISALLIVFGVISSVFFQRAPNFEFITAITLNAFLFLKNKKFSFLIVFLVVLFKDLIIGNSIIFIFTWSAYICVPVIGFFVKKSQKIKIFKRIKILKQTDKIVFLISSAISFSFFFFVWTNLGVVVVTDMYEKSFSGLLQSYINALPFLRNHLIGNILISIVMYFMYIFIMKLVKYIMKSDTFLRNLGYLYK